MNSSSEKEEILAETESRQRKSHKNGIKDPRESENLQTSDTQEGDQKNLHNWRCCRFQALPKWLQDNEYIHNGYRPPLPSFKVCFQSIFRIHTETGNIWTHLLPCIFFIGSLLYYSTRPLDQVDPKQKYVFGAFFVGAIGCLGLSSTYHTVICHSPSVGKLFHKLDYLGISLLIIGSFVPWLYYGFYCEPVARNVYMTITCVLGAAAIIVSLWDKFGTSRFRPIRAGVFAGFGLSGVLPAVHFLVTKGFAYSFQQMYLGYLIVMAVLYLVGAALYAARIPERWYPGKCDLIFQSHQIFHTLVFMAAMVHFRGITLLATFVLSEGKC